MPRNSGCLKMTKEEILAMEAGIDLILTDIGEVYKNAHDIATRTHHPLSFQILNHCNEMAEQYMVAKQSLKLLEDKL